MKGTFGRFLNDLRVKNNLTLTQLGAKLGIDSGALSKIENGKRQLDVKILPLIAKTFDLDLSEIKDEFISEQIAYKIYENKCTERVFSLAEEKIKYIKQKDVKQGNLNF